MPPQPLRPCPPLQPHLVKLSPVHVTEPQRHFFPILWFPTSGLCTCCALHVEHTSHCCPHSRFPLPCPAWQKCGIPGFPDSPLQSQPPNISLYQAPFLFPSQHLAHSALCICLLRGFFPSSALIGLWSFTRAQSGPLCPLPLNSKHLAQQDLINHLMSEGMPGSLKDPLTLTPSWLPHEALSSKRQWALSHQDKSVIAWRRARLLGGS